jgi:hypothetical protein
MGRYIEWDDVVDRYHEISSIAGADELSSHYIVYSEAFVDGILKSHYATPFSNTNIMVVKDLAIDICYWKLAYRKLDGVEAVWSYFHQVVGLLKSGQMALVGVDGVEVPQVKADQAIWSSTQSYHTSFGMDDPINWKVPDLNIEDDESRRQ